jgi:hypothetical protein
VVAAAAVAAVAAPAAPAADAAEMARTRLFGTDGVRGLANKDLTAELALELAVAAAHVLGEAGVFAGHRPLAVVGRDPRASRPPSSPAWPRPGSTSCGWASCRPQLSPISRRS